MIRYLTGVSIAETRAARRPDLGILSTPDSGIQGQRDDYLGGWAADNAFFGAPLPSPDLFDPAALGPNHWGPKGPPKCSITSTMLAVRYGPEPKLEARWWAWLSQLDPRGAHFATLPDVKGDCAATWERSAKWIGRVRALGFPVAIVMQDGLENDRFVWGSILNAADAVFIGGTDDFKLGAPCARLVAEAKARGLWVHMGRVNTVRRMRAAARRCTSWM